MPFTNPRAHKINGVSPVNNAAPAVEKMSPNYGTTKVVH
jgi:hypothetical protein